MKISQLRQACQGQNAQTIDNLIRSTDEYQAVANSDDTGEKLAVYAAAVLFLRGDAEDSDSAMAQAAEQRKAVNGAILELVFPKRQLTWMQSGVDGQLLMGSQTDFVKMLDGNEFNLNNPKTKLNCWEAVLLGAMSGGLVNNASELIRIYNDTPEEFDILLKAALVSGAGRAYQPGHPLSTPVHGDIVLFSGLAHVALAVGANAQWNQTEILSFWPAPWVSNFESGKAVTTMAVTSIEDIVQWLNTNMPGYPVTITFGSPDWNALNRS